MAWCILAFIVILSPVALLVGIIKIIAKTVKRIRQKTERKKLSPSAVMFVIGTFFVMFSGVAFGVAGWVKTTPTGRVGILLLSAVTAFAVGAVFHRLVRLDGTSSAFFSIGNFLLAVSVMTAYFYRIAGGWFSEDGCGYFTAMSASVAVMAVASLIEYKILRKGVFEYFGFLSVSALIIFVSADFSRDYDDFSLFMITFQAVISAVLYIFGFRNKKPLRVSMIISSEVYSLLSLVKVADFYFYPDAESYFIFSAVTIQLIIYGILLKKPSLKALQSVFCVLLFTMLSLDLEWKNNFNITVFFSFSMLFIYVLNRFIPHLKNRFSEIFTFFSAVSGTFFVLSEGEVSAVFVPVAMSILIILYVFSEKKSVQVIFGLVSPIIPTATAVAFYGVSDGGIVGSLCVVFLSAVTAFIIYLPVFAFGFYAKFPRKTDTVLYSNMIASGGFLCLLYMDSPEFNVIFLLACAVHFLVSFSLKNNFTAFGSAFVLIALIMDKIGENSAYYELTDFNFLIFFCILMAVSRIFFRESVVIKNEKNFRTDILMFASLAVMSQTYGFFRLVMIAVFVANLIRKNTDSVKSSVLLSVSSLIMTFAFVNRPFLIVESDVISSKITLLIFAVMGISYKYIWRNNKNASLITSQVIFILDFVGLIYDALRFHTLSNTVFVLAVTAVVLVISFTSKSKTWFGVSSTALVVITLYFMEQYVTSLDWWAYLFIAGLALIAVASLNEYCRKNGTTVKSRLAEIFDGWKW